MSIISVAVKYLFHTRTLYLCIPAIKNCVYVKLLQTSEWLLGFGEGRQEHSASTLWTAGHIFYTQQWVLGDEKNEYKQRSMLKIEKTLISFNMRKRNNFIHNYLKNAIMMTSVVIFRVSFLTLILNLLLLLVQISNLQRRHKCGVRREEGCIIRSRKPRNHLIWISEG